MSSAFRQVMVEVNPQHEQVIDCMWTIRESNELHIAHQAGFRLPAGHADRVIELSLCVAPQVTLRLRHDRELDMQLFHYTM